MKRSLFIASFVILFSACKEIRSYSEIPEVRYKEFNYNDSVLIFTFIDGDGDIGLEPYDTLPPFDPSSFYYHNLFFTFYELTDSGFTELQDIAEPFHFRIGNLPEPQGQNKTLKGEVEMSFSGFFFTFPDTFQLEFFMVDRALNQSNKERTPPLSFIRD